MTANETGPATTVVKLCSVKVDAAEYQQLCCLEVSIHQSSQELTSLSCKKDLNSSQTTRHGGYALVFKLHSRRASALI